MPDLPSLWGRTQAAGTVARRFAIDERRRLILDSLKGATTLGGRREELRNLNVAVLAGSQLAAMIALIELDGWASRIVLCPPDLDERMVPSILTEAGVAAIVSDRPLTDFGAGGPPVFVMGEPAGSESQDGPDLPTEWILFTSGTSGRPKLVVHTLHTLTGAIATSPATGIGAVWSTFYDIRRYGGLQILLRALVGGGSIVFSSPGEAPGAFIDRAALAGVSHISGTPSHWRRALLGPLASAFSPQYVRLSGEPADQAILDKLREVFPGAQVAHAFASTEAGVGFAVNDGRAGFPADLVGSVPDEVELNVCESTLRIRSPRTALRYLSVDAGTLADEENFVDTKDVVELRDGRYYFVGRRDGVINVGGLKVHPEEVEAIINQHPSVQLSLVRSRPSPIVGAIVVADVVAYAPPGDRAAAKQLETEILKACRAVLPWYKVPTAIRFVTAIAVSAAGKLARAGA